MKQVTMEFWNGSGISWTICKQSVSHSRHVHQHLISQYLQAGCSSWRPTNNVKALCLYINVHLNITNTVTLSCSEHALWCKCHICDIYYIHHTNSLTSVIQKCLRSTSDLRSVVRGRNSVFTTAVVQDKQKVVTWLRRSPVIIRGQQWLDLVTDTTLSASQHNTSYTVFNWTFLEVSLKVHLTFVQSITQTTGKLFVI